MAITKTTTPYEFLARWKNGSFAGAHVKFLETITDDGVIVSQREGDPMPVALAGGAGFPLSEILNTLQSDAITERDAATVAKATAEAALAAKDAIIAGLEAQILELTPPENNGVPQSVTRRQARQALLLAGLLDTVSLALAAIPDATQRRLAQIEWEDSLTFERQRPLLIQLSTALGLNSEQLDQLFITADTL